jgi:hypothetical protein
MVSIKELTITSKKGAMSTAKLSTAIGRGTLSIMNDESSSTKLTTCVGSFTISKFGFHTCSVALHDSDREAHDLESKHTTAILELMTANPRPRAAIVKLTTSSQRFTTRSASFVVAVKSFAITSLRLTTVVRSFVTAGKSFVSFFSGRAERTRRSADRKT